MDKKLSILADFSDSRLMPKSELLKTSSQMIVTVLQRFAHLMTAYEPYLANWWAASELLQVWFPWQKPEY